MSMFEPDESFPVRGKSASSMKLPLHCSGNAFPVSSSSSSSSSSCLGESSPESLRSLSSLNGGRTDSPLDYDVLEVTLMATVMTNTDTMTDVVLSKWLPEDEGQPHDDDDVDGRIQTAAELLDSNDTSASVYLDANSSDYRQDSWDDNLTLSLDTSSRYHGNSDDLSSGRRRHGSSTPDSDATEIPADDDDDDNDGEEALFLSVSSDICVTLTQVSSAGSTGATGLHTEGPEALKGTQDESSSHGPEETEVSRTLDPPAPSEELGENPHTPFSKHSPDNPAPGATTLTSPPEEADGHSEASKEAKTKPPGANSAVKPSNLEAKRVSKPDLKSVKTKVGSRSNMSPSKTPSQNKPTPATGRRAAPRKDEADGNKRSPVGPVKVAVVLKSIRGKSSNLKTHHKMAASTHPALPAAISQTRSASTSSVSSEVVGEGSRDAPRKATQDAPEGVEVTHPGREAGGASVEERKQKVALLMDAAVEKPPSPSKKVSSKLGPGTRQQVRGTRPDKAPSGPGSGTGPPGQGTPGEGGQTAGRGSPTRGRQNQNQIHNQGIPKLCTPAERSSTLCAQSPAASVVKPAANQQSGAGSAGRPAASTTSKLPVKGLNSSLSSSSLGSNENDAATSKASSSAPAGTKPDERPSRSTPFSGSQNAAKPQSSGTGAPGTSAPSDAAPKPPAMRSRPPSLQARTSATALKTPTVTSHSVTKMAAGQGLMKPPPLLQRGGSARLSRMSSAVEKSKPREAAVRPGTTSGGSQIAASAAGNQQLPPPEPVPDEVNANTPATPALPAPPTEAASTTSGSAGPAGHGFKARTGSRSSPKTGPRLQNSSRPGAGGATVAEGSTTAKQNLNKEQAERKKQAISQLKKLLLQGNRRVEALATVIQHLFSEREETLKQKKELSLELSRLRDEMVASSQCCERLQREKEEARVSLEEALKRLEEQHQEELVQLEDRLRSFYQTEWDKVHLVYQEEADKYRMLMTQQVEELRSRQEAERKNQEVSHSQKMESLKQEYEASIQELKRIQQTELEDLQKTLKETETSLSEKISELSAEKDDLSEKLQAEEERRRILSDKTLKDSHTVYLEQELESLKVVLEIKNNQLHQKEKKLMEMDKLVETNVKLEELLKKVQQENEDYKARMDKHAALSKQLSSEQAILQQTLQKESKVNKRLSMENEELLWKLHNGDLLASPRRLSPTSPFSSPQNSASFPTAAPLSPR
ncbi:microtubule-associated tumor suppressor 1 homolog isoform X2 [Melanotaenia boesemani]|uniref:microtubule-associated tumor suppressor 1 homolog isoform X2 n=1 Tax=Melanotaenia boesemani TaxID=1250792 RepID=UPI001C05C906|nr:microtubule-associated tumor suppressor 1 homolog isoform X2 [Melanotaenia boesemani]